VTRFTYYYIIIFIIIVLAVIIRQLLSLGHRQADNKKDKRNQESWRKVLASSEPMTERQCKWFADDDHLSAFFDIINSEPDRIATYINLLEDNSDKITEALIRCKDKTSCGYFAYLLYDLQKRSGTVIKGYKDMLMELLKRDSVYCRENALKVLFQYGDPDVAVEAITLLNQMHENYSSKLMEEILIGYNGDPKALSKALMDVFDELDEFYQVIVVRYLDITNDHIWNEYLKSKLDEAPTDLICAILRLISKEHSKENKEIFISMIEKYKDCDEITAAPAFVAATALSGYKCDYKVAGALWDGITSKHWQLRRNSARTFSSYDLTKEQVEFFTNVDDRYAKDALMYALGENKGAQ